MNIIVKCHRNMNARKDRMRVEVDGLSSRTSAKGVEEELYLLALGQEFHQVKLERHSVYAVISGGGGDLAYKRVTTSHWAWKLIMTVCRRQVIVCTWSISEAVERAHLLFILTQLNEVFKSDHCGHARQITWKNLKWRRKKNNS